MSDRTILDGPTTDIPRFWSKLFICNIGVVLAAFGTLLVHTRMSVDSLAVQSAGFAPDLQLAGGRYTNALLGMVLDALGLNPFVMQKGFYLLTFLSMAFAVTLLSRAYLGLCNHDTVKKALLLDLVMLVSFVNPWCLLHLLFPETLGYFAVSPLLIPLTVVFFFRGTEHPRNYPISATFLFLTLGVYQVYVGSFIAYVLFGLWIRYHEGGGGREFVLGSGIALIIAIGSSILNLALKSFLISAGVIVSTVKDADFGIAAVLENSIGVLRYQMSLFVDGAGIFPRFVVPVCALVILGLLVFLMYRNRKAGESAALISIMVVAYLGLFAPHYVEAQSFYPGRENLPIAAFVSSMLAVLCVLSMERHETSNGGLWRFPGFEVCLGLVLCMLSISIAVIQDISIENLLVMQKDLDTASVIVQEIEEQESSEGVSVEKIATCDDSSFQWYYSDTGYSRVGDFNMKSIRVGWSTTHLLEYVSGRSFEKVDMPADVYEKNFSGKDWDTFSPDEEIVVEDDTAYICFN